MLRCRSMANKTEPAMAHFTARFGLGVFVLCLFARHRHFLLGNLTPVSDEIHKPVEFRGSEPPKSQYKEDHPTHGRD